MKDLYFENTKTIRQRQWELLQEQLKYTVSNSSFYRELFEKHKLSSGKIKTPEDFRKIPLTTKEDLQLRNVDFCAVAREEIIDFVTTSGTLGDPVSFALNEADLQRLAENEYQSFKMAGVKKSDIVQITTTLDRRFMAGMAYFLGLRKLGAGIVRTGSGLPQLQWESIRRFKPKYLIAVPSFLLKMIAYARENNIDYKNSSVKAAICIGEPLRDENFELNALGRKITEAWKLELYSTYASTEMATAFTECEKHRGNHLLPDLIYAEVLNDKGKPVKDGEIGELVVTPLGTQTMPLLRFATGDMLRMYSDSCKCGRNTPRLSALVGRKKQMIKLKGTSLYPQHLLEAINSFNELGSFVIEAHHNDLGTDEVTIKVSEKLPTERIQQLKDHFKSVLHVTPKIVPEREEVIERLRFPRESRKPHLFRDLR